MMSLVSSFPGPRRSFISRGFSFAYNAYGHSVDHEFEKYMHVLFEGAVADVGPQPGLQLLIVDSK
jgi:hypothetical protein